MDVMRVARLKHSILRVAENPAWWQTRNMHTKAIVLTLAALASTGFGPAAQAPKPAPSAASKVVVYKSPT